MTGDAPKPAPTDWAELIEQASGHIKPVGAVTFLRRRTDTASNPVYVQADDNKTYVLKALRTDAEQGRMLFNDQVVARLGALIGAAVPPVALVAIPQSLIDLNPHPQQGMGHCRAGICHGSELIKDVMERIDQFQYVADDDNKRRFTILGVLHAWIGFSDRQFLYEINHPFRVSAVDHGHFFPNGPNWTLASLATAAAPVVAADLVGACSLARGDLYAGCSALAKATDGEIARILAIPPAEWGVKINERIGVAKYLSARRDVLLTAYAPQKEGDK